MFVFFAFSGVCTVCETTVDLQVRALMFFQCGVLWFCYAFTLVEEGNLRIFFRRWVQAVTVALSYGAEKAVGQTNYQRWVCARGKGLRFQGGTMLRVLISACHIRPANLIVAPLFEIKTIPLPSSPLRVLIFHCCSPLGGLFR